MPEATRVYYFIFGFLTIAGGIMGFVSKKSVPSLIAGGVSGALLLVAGFLAAKTGLILGLLVSLLLAGKFIPDYFAKRRLIPAGIMVLLSIAGGVLSILALAKL